MYLAVTFLRLKTYVKHFVQLHYCEIIGHLISWVEQSTNLVSINMSIVVKSRKLVPTKLNDFTVLKDAKYVNTKTRKKLKSFLITAYKDCYLALQFSLEIYTLQPSMR